MNTHIVFDLDGTLTDTQKIHQQVESDFLQSKWIIITPEIIWIKYAWRTPKERISELLLSEKIDFTHEEVGKFVDGKDDIILSLLHIWKINLMPYALEALKYLHDKGYKIWISSWSARDLLDELISYFGLDAIIVASTSANEVKNKKPHPDVFLSSFRKIEEIYGVPNSKYVIWDWWSDMEWWYKAWAKTIWLNYAKKEKLNDIYCNVEIKSLEELKNIL